MPVGMSFSVRLSVSSLLGGRFMGSYSLVWAWAVLMLMPVVRMRPQVRLANVCFIEERLWLKSACVLEFGGMMALGCCFLIIG